MQRIENKNNAAA